MTTQSGAYPPWVELNASMTAFLAKSVDRGRGTASFTAASWFRLTPSRLASMSSFWWMVFGTRTTNLPLLPFGVPPSATPN